MQTLGDNGLTVYHGATLTVSFHIGWGNHFLRKLQTLVQQKIQCLSVKILIFREFL